MTSETSHEELQRKVQDLEKQNQALQGENKALMQETRALRRETRLLQSVLDSIPDIIGVQMPDHSILRYNRAGYELLNKTENEVQGKKCYGLIGRSEQCSPCATSRAKESGGPREVDKYFPDLDVYLNCRSVPVFDGNGEISFFVEILRDETEKKQAGKKMREAWRQYKDFFENAPIGICRLDSEGRYIEVNSVYARMCGYSSPEVMLEEVGTYPSSIMHAEDARALFSMLERKGSVVDFECKIWRRDGTRIWTSRSARVVLDSSGNVQYYELFVYDIQARKEAELAGQQARRQLLGVLDQLEAGVYVISRENHRTIYANKYMTRVAGMSLIGREAGKILLKERDKTPVWTKQEAFREIGDARTEELQFQDGRWYLCTAKLTPWLGKEPVILVVAMDITIIKEAENIKEEMDRLVKHDLKGPLDGIIRIPDLLISSEEYPEEDVELLEGIKMSGRKMLNLIDSSLSLYKLEEGDYEIDQVEIDLIRELKMVEHEVEQEVRLKNLDIEYRLQDRPLSSTDLVTLKGDRTLIPFLFSNLVKNAVEASPPGEKVVVRMRPGERFRISVHNQGSVPEEIRQRFFDKYVTRGKKKGTGLGTYSSRLIAKAHGGEISMHSSEEQGTTVTVALPQNGR